MTAQAIATIIGSVLVFLLGIITLFVQSSRATKAQRGDHAATADMVRQMGSDLSGIKGDISYVKADVGYLRDDLGEVKAEVRAHGEELRGLRHLAAQQDHIDTVLADNNRVIHEINERRRAQ